MPDNRVPNYRFSLLLMLMRSIRDSIVPLPTNDWLIVKGKDPSMVDYKNLPIGDQAPSVIYAIVEGPNDSKHKYEYDPALGVFRLDRVLHSAVYYPTEYGFIRALRLATVILSM